MANAAVDLGMGLGVKIYHCNLSEKTKNDTRGMFKLKAPGLWDIELPYYFVKERQYAYNADPAPCSYPLVQIVPYINGQDDYSRKFEARARIVYGSGFYWERPNQRTEQTFSGKIITYDSNLSVCHGVLSIRGLDYETGKELERFITDVLEYNTYSFKIGVYR